MTSVRPSGLTSHEGDRETLQEDDWAASGTCRLTISCARTTVGTAIARNAESLIAIFRVCECFHRFRDTFPRLHPSCAGGCTMHGRSDERLGPSLGVFTVEAPAADADQSIKFPYLTPPDQPSCSLFPSTPVSLFRYHNFTSGWSMGYMLDCPGRDLISPDGYAASEVPESRSFVRSYLISMLVRAIFTPLMENLGE